MLFINLRPVRKKPLSLAGGLFIPSLASPLSPESIYKFLLPPFCSVAWFLPVVHSSGFVAVLLNLFVSFQGRKEDWTAGFCKHRLSPPPPLLSFPQLIMSKL